MSPEIIGFQESDRDYEKNSELRNELANLEERIRNAQSHIAVMKLHLDKETFLKWDDAANRVIAKLSNRRLSLQRELDDMTSNGDRKEDSGI